MACRLHHHGMKVHLAFLLGLAAMAMAQLPASLINSNPPAAQGGTSYRNALQPTYTAILSLDPKAEGITPAQVSRLRTFFSSLAPGPERDAAMRFIGIAEKVAVLTVETRKRYYRPGPSRSDGADTDAFFKQGVKAGWLAAMKPLAAAATAEWARIPAAAASPLLTESPQEKLIALTRKNPFPSDVVIKQLLGNGALAEITTPDRSGIIFTTTGYVHGLGKPQSLVDGDPWKGTLYLAGTYEYRTVSGAPRTVRRYTLSPEAAVELMVDQAKREQAR